MWTDSFYKFLIPVSLRSCFLTIGVDLVREEIGRSGAHGVTVGGDPDVRARPLQAREAGSDHPDQGGSLGPGLKRKKRP